MECLSLYENQQIEIWVNCTPFLKIRDKKMMFLEALLKQIEHLTRFASSILGRRSILSNKTFLHYF
jgi:hypothetical protein